jgi:hypothetical protein
VAAGALIGPGGVVVSDDPGWIHGLFENPIGAARSARSGSRRGAAAYADAITFLDRCRDKEEQKWISENRSA